MKCLLIFSFILSLTISYSQKVNFFIKYNNELTNLEIERINNLIRENWTLELYCPFSIPDKALNRTFVLSSIPQSIKKIGLKFKESIEYIEEVPNYEFFYTPNDLNVSQWNLGQVNAELAWNETMGSNVLVAVVDDAVEMSHLDLNANIWTNPGEIPGNAIDDDGNGYVDDINGWDAANMDNDPSPPAGASSSYFSHGTHCAGIVGAVTDNNIGISSIGFNTTIIPVKIADDATSSLTNAYTGVDYAIASGAKVISMSWGGSAYSITYQNIFDFAYTQGIVCVAAAGNNNSSSLMYPASYNHVISVGATDNTDAKSSFSNFGSAIDVMAPGSNILSTVPGGGYSNKSGTSMACPLVSGLISLMLAKNSSLNPDEIEQCLKNSCDNIDPQNSTYIGQIGAGRINALTSLQCLKPITSNFQSDFTFICVNGQIQFWDLSNNNPTAWEWSFTGGIPSTSVTQNPMVTYTAAGSYDVQLIVHNVNGSDTLKMVNYVTVGTPSAIISGSTNVLQGNSGFLNIAFTGSPPFSYVYTDGTNNFPVSNVVGYTDQQIVSPNVTTNYSLVSVFDANCNGLVFGSAIITIIQNNSGCSSSGFIPFHKEFSSTNDDVLKSLVATSDGGVIMLAKSPTSYGQADYLLVKLDANYDVQWQTTLGSSSEEGVASSDIIEDANGDFVFVSQIQSSSSSVSSRQGQIIKVDALGNLVWNQTLNAINADTYRTLYETQSGTYLVIGTTNQVIADSDYLLSEYDANGVLLNNIVLGEGGNDHALDVLELANGHFVIVGGEEVSGVNRSGTFTILDANLNILLNKSYSFSNNVDRFGAAIQKSNGNILIQGLSKSPVFGMVLLEVDLSGNVIWSKTYHNGVEHEGGGLLDIGNGLIAVSGVFQNAGTQQPFMMGIDDLGNVAWSKSYPIQSNALSGDPLKVISLSNDGGILLGGSHVTGGVNNLNLFKTDLCGNMGCGEIDANINGTTVNLTPTNLSFSDQVVGTVGVFSVSHQSLANYLSTDVCIGSINVGNNPICSVDADFNAVGSQCLADSTFFTDLSTNNNGTIVYWSWDFGDGNSVSGIQNPSHQYAGGGIYNVELIVGTDSSCFDTIIQSITVVNQTTLSIPDSVICVNDSIQINPVFSCSPSSYVASWMPSIGVSNPNILNPVFGPSVTTVYTLTVTDNLGGVTTESFVLSVDNSCCVTIPDIAINNPICIGEEISIVNNTIPNGAATFIWNFGVDATPSNYTGQNPPDVQYVGGSNSYISITVVDNCGTSQDSVAVYINPLPPYEIANDTVSCDSNNFNLGGFSIGNLVYLWSPGNLVSDPLNSNPFSTSSSSQLYTLIVSDPFTNCSVIDQVMITLDSCPCELNLPNIFTPNADGVNDLLKFDDSSCKTESLQIFNRWGELMFDSDGYLFRWDGRTSVGLEVPEGTYYYILVANEIPYAGHFLLLR